MAQPVGVDARPSRASTLTQCRQRGGGVVRGEVVMLDLAGADALTSEYLGASAKNNPGTPTVASSPMATVLAATADLAVGRVGVADAAVADNALGGYEFGEAGEGAVNPVVTRALVLVDAASTRKAALQIKEAGGISHLAPGTAGTSYAILLEDATADDGSGPNSSLVLRWVILHSHGVATGAGGGAAAPEGDEGDFVVIGPGGELVAIPPPGGTGDVVKVGTPANNQVGVWTGDGTIEGAGTLTYDGTALGVTGNIAVSGTVDGRDVAADGTKLDGIEALADVTDATNVDAAGAVMNADYNANTVLIATLDNTPVASSAADLRTFINVEDGATADQSGAEILAALLTVDGAGSGLDADLLDGNSSAAFATAAQGATADSALQPGDNATDLDGTAHRLFYTDGAGDIQELPFGANGTYLRFNGATSAPTADTPAGGSAAPFGLAPIASRYHSFIDNLATVTTSALVSGRMYLRPFIPKATITPSSLNLYVTAGVASTDVEFLIYSSHATTYGPDTLLYASGAIAAATSSANATASTSMPTLTGGTQYWWGITAFGTSTVRAAAGLPAMNGGMAGAAAAAVDNVVTRTSITIGAAPDPFVLAGADLATLTVPLVTFVAP